MFLVRSSGLGALPSCLHRGWAEVVEGRWLGLRDLCPGHVLEPGARPGPCSLLVMPPNPVRGLPCSHEANSFPSLESPYLVSRASFCPRLARHTLGKEVGISFYPGIGEPQALAALPPTPNPDPLPSSALAVGAEPQEATGGPAMATGMVKEKAGATVQTMRPKPGQRPQKW